MRRHCVLSTSLFVFFFVGSDKSSELFDMRNKNKNNTELTSPKERSNKNIEAESRDRRQMSVSLIFFCQKKKKQKKNSSFPLLSFKTASLSEHPKKNNNKRQNLEARCFIIR